MPSVIRFSTTQVIGFIVGITSCHRGIPVLSGNEVVPVMPKDVPYKRAGAGCVHDGSWVLVSSVTFLIQRGCRLGVGGKKCQMRDLRRRKTLLCNSMLCLLIYGCQLFTAKGMLWFNIVLKKEGGSILCYLPVSQVLTLTN